MSAPYNPGPGGNQPGQQPQWGGYPGGANYPQQGQPGYGDQSGPPQQGGYQAGNYPGNYPQGNYPQQQGSGYGYQQQSSQSAQSPSTSESWRSSYDAELREAVGVVGLALAAVGALLLILGIAALDWYSAGGDKLKLSDLHKAAKEADIGLMKAYGGFLVWILVVLVVVAAVLASVPGPAAATFRVVAPVVGLLGLVITLVALNSFWSKAKDAGSTDVGIFKHSAIGLYLTLLGFVVAGIAGVFGPRRA